MTKVTWNGVTVWTPKLSVTPMSNEYVPILDGVPYKTPALGSMLTIPGGWAFIEKVYGGVPPTAVICCEYATFTIPLGRGEVVLKLGGGLIVMVYGVGVWFWLESVAMTTMLKVPATVGVPDKTPALVTERPEGYEFWAKGFCAVAEKV